MIITIDGPVATGKSTIAKMLAQELGYVYFDTGAMYRGLTLLAMEKNINMDDPKAIEDLLMEFNFEIKLKNREKAYFVNNQDVTLAIRSPQINEYVSKISANPAVREKLVATQREFSIGINAVFEGRDMGTIVFPSADLKIFLTASSNVRARRRFNELKALFPEENQNLTLEEALDNLNKRDYYDTTREFSPLKKASDAFEIDTSDLTLNEVVIKILELKDSKNARY